MSVEVSIGTKLPLDLVLQDGETDKFPIAEVKDQNNVLIPGSPFSLTHIGGGRYTNYAFTVRTQDKRLTAKYKVYDDAAHTLQTPNYYDNAAEDVFDCFYGDEYYIGKVTQYQLAVPDDLELPTSGSKRYRFAVYLFDKFGNPADPDSNYVEIHIEDINNGEIILPAALTREQKGVYWYKYQVNWNDFEQPLWVEFVYWVNGVEHLIGETAETIRERAVLDVIETQRLTATRAANLDNLDVAVSSRQSTVSALTQYTNLVTEINQNETKIDTVITKIGNPYGGSVATALNAIKTYTDKIGNPANGTLAQDNIIAYTELLKIGLPVTGTIASDIAALTSLIGLPALGTVSLDIASIKNDTFRIGTPTYVTLAQDNLHTWSLIGSPITGTLTGDINNVDSDVNAVNVKLGAPATGSIAGDIASVKTDTSGLRTDITTLRAQNLDNLDTPVSSRQSTATALSQYNSMKADLATIISLLGAFPSNHLFVAEVPRVLLLPQTGSKTYRLFVNLYNNANN